MDEDEDDVDVDDSGMVDRATATMDHSTVSSPSTPYAYDDDDASVSAADSRYDSRRSRMMIRRRRFFSDPHTFNVEPNLNIMA